MLFKLVFLALLLVVKINNISAEPGRKLLQQTTDDDDNEPETTELEDNETTEPWAQETTEDSSISFDETSLDSPDPASPEDDSCDDLEQTECNDEDEDGDGDKDCSFNSITQECYSIIRSEGQLGHGNFDDGYTAAQQQAVEDAAQLNKIVAVLGALIGLLILIIAGGAYYIYAKQPKSKQSKQTVRANSVASMERIYNDESPMVTTNTL
eukprot:UN00022